MKNSDGFWEIEDHVSYLEKGYVSLATIIIGRFEDLKCYSAHWAKPLLIGELRYLPKILSIGRL